MSINEAEVKRIDNAIENALSILREHVEAAQIFVSVTDEHGTAGRQCGFGNHYARVGQVQEWLDAEAEINRDAMREKS